MNFLENGVTGHRGDPQHFPQNTLTGFSAAIAMNCDWVETDIHLTGDGHVVISHDADTRSEGDLCRVIHDTPLQELRKINMAQRFNMNHDDRPELFEKMPTLEEVIELFRSQSKVRLSLQPKAPGVVQAAAKIIKDMKYPAEMLGFNDANLAYMIEAKQFFPESTIFYDRLKADTLEDDIAVSHQYGFSNIVVNEKYLTQAAVDRMFDAGITPGVWTVANPEEMDRFIAMNVKRFYTDYPAVLMNKLK